MLDLHMDGIIRGADIAYEQFVDQPATNQTTVTENLTSRVQSFSNDKQESVNFSITPPVQQDNLSPGKSLNKDLKNREYHMILDILNATMGNRKMAAERLGISQRTLRYKLAKMRDLGMAIPGGFANKVVGANPA